MSTRNRAIVGATLVAVLGLFSTACGGATTSTTTGAWSFKDDRGTEIKRDRRPVTIVAESGMAAALWEYGIKVKGVFGPQKKPDGSRDPQVGNVDLSQVTDLGQEYGQVNLEKLAVLKPDIVVTSLQGKTVWGIDEGALGRVDGIAPIVGIQVAAKDTKTLIGRVEDLVTALGGKVDGDPVTRAKADLAKAEQAVRDAVAAKPNLKVEVVNAGKDALYVTRLDYHHDVRYFRQLGVNIVGPAGADESWETVSWEQASRYPADLILLDNRLFSLQNDDLKKTQPTWTKLPAVTAGQVGVWHTLVPISYAANVIVLNDLAATLTRSTTL
ncbi:ABC transporter substrate-binding protein [Pseudonocardiaceae bacterium YIM PH 21723]|nr:ABC transporter substrate-binding protein [Pseudonocardiaceae bacterium YIM PH 21723]